MQLVCNDFPVGLLKKLSVLADFPGAKFNSNNNSNNSNSSNNYNNNNKPLNQCTSLSGKVDVQKRQNRKQGGQEFESELLSFSALMRTLSLYFLYPDIIIPWLERDGTVADIFIFLQSGSKVFSASHFKVKQEQQQQQTMMFSRLQIFIQAVTTTGLSDAQNLGRDTTFSNKKKSADTLQTHSARELLALFIGSSEFEARKMYPLYNQCLSHCVVFEYLYFLSE